MSSLLLILAFFNLIDSAKGRTECFLVTGRLRCPTEQRKAIGVKIDLLDDDPLPLESDDLMGRTWSIYNGTFAGIVYVSLSYNITGCGSDFGPFNTPDAYIRIEHSCPHRQHGESRVIELDVLPIYLPRVANLGSIYLDRYLDDIP
ncbi:Transthyretin-like family protein [Ancylostoma caninum]|uniref:Transthyretin-like family protein n=1 Tax=Ancylostoma caninum TaxID=29170 RepID=A0A368GAR7_ANCCA|nr:Transthyretin-like family protein [Ancylostoma caninum]